MQGNYRVTNENTPCDNCGITEKEAEKQNHGVDVTRGQYEVTEFETSFSLKQGPEGKYLCAVCSQEERMKKLFDTMDKLEKRK